jgi:hypothetical protein
MGIVIGDHFEDYGGTEEYTVSSFRAFERLNGNRVRLYLTEERGDRHVLLYTAVVPLSAMEAMGRKCLEIATGDHLPMPDWAIGRLGAAS